MMEDPRVADRSDNEGPAADDGTAVRTFDAARARGARIRVLANGVVIAAACGKHRHRARSDKLVL